MGAIRANELLKFHTDARAYVAGFHVVMNQRSYDGLPADVQSLLDDMTGDNLVARFGTWWDAWDARGKNDAIERSNEIIEIDNDTRAEWRTQLQPMITGFLDGMGKQGVADPQALYGRAQKLVAQFEGA